MSDRPAYLCPHCQQPVELPEDLPSGFITCPHCSGDFALSSDLEPPPQADQAPDAELDAARIRQLSQVRRAAWRSRSYAIIAAIVCLVAVIKLIHDAVVEWRDGYRLLPSSYVLFAAVAIYGIWYFVHRAAELHREANRLRAADEPAAAPDFSSLGNGSQVSDALDRMTQSPDHH